MNFGEVRTIVRDYINDVTADVDQHIVDAVNFLSIVFPQKKIDNSQVTVNNQSYLDKPANCMRIRRITIDDVEIKELVNFENLEPSEDEEIMKWYEDDNKIQFTTPMTSSGETIEIWYDVSFIVDSGGNWDETQPAGNVIKAWYAAASSVDGFNLFVASASGRLYTSSDGGATWTESRPNGDANFNWKAVASDSDGSNLIVGASWGRLYTSSDGGATWTERQPVAAADDNWQNVASDSDGSNLIVADYGGRVWTSDDFGVTWTERQPAGAVNKNWNSVASDSDGSNLIVCVNYGRIYTSDDFGVTWTERQPAGAVDILWTTVASDNDGSNLIAGYYEGYIYISNDFGVTWTRTGFWKTIKQNWRAIASDADGSNLIAGVYTGSVFIYSDDLEINVLDLLTELVYVGAAYRYYRKMVSIKVTSPATYPDIELDEIRKVLEYWKDDYYRLLDEIIKYKK